MRAPWHFARALAAKGLEWPTAAVVLGAVLSCACSSAEPGITGGASSAACGSCHVTEYAAWNGSRLASSGSSPVFEALSARVASAWGEDARARCESCHRPGYGGDHGIGCVACHSATGNLGVRDGLLTVDTSQPVSGPFADALSTPAHGSRTYGFLTSPELCGTCHDVTGPRLFHETTLEEYDASSAAGRGLTCAGCHMPSVTSGPLAVDETRERAREDHSFVGLDPAWGATRDVAAASAERTTALLRAGLALEATRSATDAGFDVVLRNEAGHAVPTGITILRDVWIDVELVGADGRSERFERVIELGSQPTHRGRPVALITDADAVEPRLLPPGASTTAHVEPTHPLAPPVVAAVTLRARAVRAAVLDALGLAARAAEVPTHDVASVRVR